MELRPFFRLSLQGTRRLVILGVGSALKADDAAGAEIAARLSKKYTEKYSDMLRIFSGGTAPENFTGAIKDFAPDHVLIIDAADIGEAPGTVSVIHPDAISGVSFSTHMLPLKIMTDYLRQETGCDITIIGVQPADLSFGALITTPVRTTIRRVVNALDTVLHELFERA